MPVLGGLPRETNLRTWSALIPQPASSSLLISQCKPLTLLQNLVNSGVRISVKLSKKLLCPVCTDVRTETRSGSNCILETILGVCLNLCTRWAVLTAFSDIIVVYILNGMKHANLTFIHFPVFVIGYQFIVIWEQYFQIQFDPGHTGTRRFPGVLDNRDLCLYNDGWIVLCYCCYFIFYFCWLSPTSTEDQRHGAFECCQSCSKANKPSVLFKPNNFGLINVYCNVYSHGFSMVTCFHPISIPVTTWNQILQKRLGFWCRFPLYTHWFWRKICDRGQGFETFYVYTDC